VAVELKQDGGEILDGRELAVLDGRRERQDDVLVQLIAAGAGVAALQHDQSRDDDGGLEQGASRGIRRVLVQLRELLRCEVVERAGILKAYEVTTAPGEFLLMRGSLSDINGSPRIVILPYRALAQDDVSGAFAGEALGAFVSQGAGVDSVQEVLSGAEKDGADGEVKLVDQGGLEIFTNDGDSAAKADVARAGGSFRLFQGGVDALGDEAELGAALHLERGAGVVGQDEDGT